MAGPSNAGHADPIQMTADSLATLTTLLFYMEMKSADTGVILYTIRSLADQTTRQALEAHRRQVRFYRSELRRSQEGRDTRRRRKKARVA